MKGRQKSLTAFLKATNLSSRLLADLLILLLMIVYSSSLFFLFSFILFVVLFPFFIPFEKGKYFITYQSLNISLLLQVLNEIQSISMELFQQSLAPWFQHPWLLSVTVPFPCLRQLCVQDQFAFSKTCSQGPQEIISLHPFLDFLCHSWCPEHISSAPLFHYTMRSFLNSHLHGSEAIHYIVYRGFFSFSCYFQFKERRIKWFLQREGEQIKEWMNRSMNKTFVEQQKYACYLASWSAIIFIPCRGYSVSLFLGLDPNLTDVALALQAELQSTNLLHLSLLH